MSDVSLIELRGWVSQFLIALGHEPGLLSRAQGMGEPFVDSATLEEMSDVPHPELRSWFSHVLIPLLLGRSVRSP